MSDGPYVVALTGGVASGKSAVARRIAELGVPVFDADVAAREVVAPGSEGFNAVIEAFGPEALGDDGGLDRAWLRQRIFDDAEARKQLESILHPRINQHLQDQVEGARAPWVLLVIPLLAETWPAYDWVDRILVVDVPEHVQHARLVERDNITDALARQMLTAQAARRRRLELADDVIDNTDDLDALDRRVQELARTYPPKRM